MDRVQAQTGFVSPKRSRLAIAAGLILTVIAVLAFLSHHFWPFTEAAVRSNLASAAAADVQFGSFRPTYFPPGCIAENVTFRRTNSNQPFITIRRLTITSNPTALLRRHVGLFHAEGMHLTVSLREFSRNQIRKQKTIDTLVADDAVLEISQRNSQPLKFTFHRFSMSNLNGPGVTKFSAVFENPLPRAVISTSGQFGPWNATDPTSTAVSGKYSLEHADLSVFHSIAGITTSDGNFSGTINQLDVQGTTQTPTLEVTSTHHGLPLNTSFSATVDALTGDVILQHVNATFGKDVISASGTIARRSNGKRSAILDLRSDHGRIEDTFFPFIHSPTSPLTGDVTFQMHVTIPSGHERFLKKIELTSNFQISNARFTNPTTETRLNQVSAPPKQQEGHELADFQGSVILVGGIAKFSNLAVHDEDAAALFRGSYDLTDEKVNLRGKLKTEASLAKTTHGIKAVFAKALEPFFKKRPHVTVVPVRIGGTYSHPNFGLDIGS